MELRVDDGTLLRTRSIDDVGPLFTLIDTNRAHLRRWLSWLDWVNTPADTRARTEHLLAQEEAGTHLALLIERGGELGGVVSFNTIDRVHRTGELGFWLRADWEGRGIVTRSCAALVEYGFDGLKLNRVHAGAAVGNARSRAVLDRLRFNQYGVSPDAEWLYDHFVDHACYALLRRDWDQSRRRGGARADVRRADDTDLPFLRRMLVEAAYWRVATAPVDVDEALERPDLAYLLEDWGRRGDLAFIAEAEQPIGAAWLRLWTPGRHSYGYVDPETPELGIGVVANARGQGIGTMVLEALLDEAKRECFPRVSLSVEVENPALRLYRRLGFQEYHRDGDAWTMVKVLD